MGRYGFTIIELMVACALFLLALGIVSQLAVLGMRSKVTTEDKNVAYRRATDALDQLNRDLAHCQEIYQPAAFTDAHPGKPGQPGLVLRTESSRSGSPGPAVVGYSLEPRTRNLLRVLYAPNYNPAVPATHVPAPGERPTVQAQWVDDFHVSRVDPATHAGARMVDSELRISTVYQGKTGPSVLLTTRTRLRQL